MANSKPLYQSILGEEYEKLAASIRELHDLKNTKKYRGICQITVGQHPLARLITKRMSLPKAGNSVPLLVEFTNKSGVEHWARYFDQKPFYSQQSQVGELLHEKISFITLAFRLQVIGSGLKLHLIQIYFFKLPILKLCRLKIEAREWEENGVFHLQVAVKAPIIGQLIEYRGWLTGIETLEPQQGIKS